MVSLQGSNSECMWCTRQHGDQGRRYDGTTFPPDQVCVEGHGGEAACSAQHAPNLRSRGRTVFEHDRPARRQVIGQVLQKVPDGVKAVRAEAQCQVRFMEPNVFAQGGPSASVA